MTDAGTDQGTQHGGMRLKIGRSAGHRAPDRKPLTKPEVIVMKPVSAILVTCFAVAAVVLGYLYYQETKNDVTISVDPPKVKVN